MIMFETLKWHNFLSTGHNWTEINFCEHPTTLIVGHNGAGKSTMLDALSFALFGRPHRNISKAQLVNSINNKDCRVEVTFTVNGSSFKIVRGIKPVAFEIWKNGEMINQDSHSKEYQKVLEANILKLTHKSFHQIVVLGSSSFVPFMQLTNAHRRDVIEDLLDINVFSKMNQLLKEKNSVIRDAIREASHQIDILSTKTEAHKNYIKEINRINKDLKSQKESAIVNLRAEMNDLHNENAGLSLKINHQNAIWPTKQHKCNDRKIQLVQMDSQLKAMVKNIVTETKFFQDNDTCPTCSQPISEHIKMEKMSKASTKAKEIQSALRKMGDELSTVDEEIRTAQSNIEQIRGWQNTLNINNQAAVRIERSIEELLNEIENLTDTTSDLTKAKEDLDAFIAAREKLVETKLTATDQYQYNQAIGEMLKDTGIKTKIIRQYMPVINKFVNQYLQILDFFVLFHLDESFSEEIKSRHRDSFSYDSFSEGEKQRIDLALLFTWRQIAKMKNSVSTNLLILDETFDSSLDYEGVDNLMKILYSLGDDTNTFVISHKGDILEGRFSNKIEFHKDKNFSKIKGT
jgi:DNA repair exonuclease SbcCD ATPase subunit